MRYALFGALVLLLGHAVRAECEPKYEEIYCASEHECVRMTMLPGEVPLYAVNGHHWASYAWAHAFARSKDRLNWPLGKITLIHVDAHSDMAPGTMIPLTMDEALSSAGRFLIAVRDSLKPLGSNGIDSFIVPMIPFFFARLVWVKPDFSAGYEVDLGKHQAQYVQGSKNGQSGAILFHPDGWGDETEVDKPLPRSIEEIVRDWGVVVEETRVIPLDVIPVTHEVDLQGPYILDIDMDFFSCIGLSFQLPHVSDDTRDIEKRLDEFAAFLSRLSRPAIAITVAESRGVPAQRVTQRLRNPDGTTWKPYPALAEPPPQMLWEGAFTPEDAIPIIRAGLVERLMRWNAEISAMR